MISKKLVALKTILFLLFFLFIQSFGIAQNFKWVMQTDIGFSKLQRKNTAGSIKTSPSISYKFGGGFYYKLGPSLAIELGFKHTEIRVHEKYYRSSTSTIIKSSLKYHAKYYSIPFLVKSEHGRLSYNIGIRYMRLLKVRIISKYNKLNLTSNVTINQSVNLEDKSIRKHDLGPLVGISYQFKSFLINTTLFIGTKKTYAIFATGAHRRSYNNLQLSLGLSYFLYRNI